MDIRPYGVGALGSTRLLDGAGDPPGITFAAPTLVASDVKRSSDQVALGDLTAEFVAFTSGSEEPRAGDVMTNNSETAVWIGSKLTSGTWAGGDAAGTAFLEQVSGTLASGAAANGTTGTADALTLSADATPAIGAIAISGEIWFALTSSEMTCKQINVYFLDQAATVWAADGVQFQTIGDFNAMHVPSFGGALIFATTIETATSTTDWDLVDGPSTDAAIPAGSVLIVIDQTTKEVNGVVRSNLYDQSDNNRLTLQEAPGITCVAGDHVYILAASPALEAIETAADAIQTKTDSLEFTVAGRVDSQVLGIVAETLTGDGDGTPFDVA